MSPGIALAIVGGVIGVIEIIKDFDFFSKRKRTLLILKISLLILVILTVGFAVDSIGQENRDNQAKFEETMNRLNSLLNESKTLQYQNQIHYDSMIDSLNKIIESGNNLQKESQKQYEAMVRETNRIISQSNNLMLEVNRGNKKLNDIALSIEMTFDIKSGIIKEYADYLKYIIHRSIEFSEEYREAQSLNMSIGRTSYINGFLVSYSLMFQDKANPIIVSKTLLTEEYLKFENFPNTFSNKQELKDFIQEVNYMRELSMNFSNQLKFKATIPAEIWSPDKSLDDSNMGVMQIEIDYDASEMTVKCKRIVMSRVKDDYSIISSDDLSGKQLTIESPGVFFGPRLIPGTIKSCQIHYGNQFANSLYLPANKILIGTNQNGLHLQYTFK
jgi:hypothetical protein